MLEPFVSVPTAVDSSRPTADLDGSPLRGTRITLGLTIYVEAAPSVRIPTEPTCNVAETGLHLGYGRVDRDHIHRYLDVPDVALASLANTDFRFNRRKSLSGTKAHQISLKTDVQNRWFAVATDHLRRSASGEARLRFRHQETQIVRPFLTFVSVTVGHRPRRSSVTGCLGALSVCHVQCSTLAPD